MAAVKPLALIIMDGYGYRTETKYNAIAAAKKPNLDRLFATCAYALAGASGMAVGLPEGQMGNSEVGHLNLGAGRVVYQEIARIDKAISDQSFFHNQALIKAVDLALHNDKALHIYGLLSPGGVHSHERHIQAMVKLAVDRGLRKIYVHGFLDGRDMPPRSAKASIELLERQFADLECGKIVSLIGRYYAMDRDQRWNRVQQAYDLFTRGQAVCHATTAVAGLQCAYDRGEGDEFVKATAIHDKDSDPIVVGDGDTVVFMNFRADRAREITETFIDPSFSGFRRAVMPHLATYVSLCQYDIKFKIPVAFPPEQLGNCLGEYVSGKGLEQLRIAETEKYAHVTFFFNGGVEKPSANEDRILIKSPHVATYDLQPEMRAFEVTDRLVAEIASGKYDMIICNYANCDMVGHTGVFDAAVAAVEAVDTCVGRVVTALHKQGGEALIIADHGNADVMFNDQTDQPFTAHSLSPVPFIYTGSGATVVKKKGVILADVAPTMLSLMGLDIPEEMTGEPVFKV